MHEGYLEFSGTEVINASRTRAYAHAFVPGVRLDNQCCPCEHLGDHLGDGEYASPQQDGAPWFSPTNKATAGFYGLLPLGLQGFEASTSSTPVVENVVEGASFGRPRRASRALRFSALAIAQSEESMDAGLAWLRDVLTNEGCADGDCSGGTLCWLADCPPPCDFGDYPDTPVDFTFADKSVPQMRAITSTWSITDGLVSYSPSGYVEVAGRAAVVNIPMVGLIPGQTYRLEYNVTASGSFADPTIEVPGALAPRVIYTAPISTASANLDLAMEVAEFVAQEEATVVQIAAGGADVSVYISGIRVRHVERPGVVYQRMARYQQGRWPGEWTLSSAYATDPQWRGSSLGAATLNFWFSQAASFTADAMTSIGTVRVTGLQPGVPARVLISGSGSYFTTSSGSITTPLGVSVDGGEAQPVDEPTLIEFTPTSEAAFIDVGAYNSNLFPTAASSPTRSLALRVESIRVEQVHLTTAGGQGLEPLRRTLSAVSSTSGPLVTGVFPTRTAVLRKIEWEMVAGSPRIEGEPLLHIPDPEEPGPRTQDVACVNGSPVEVNLINNPSFETNLTNWSTTVSAADFTLTRVSVPDAFDGSYVMRLQYTGSTPSSVGAVNIGSWTTLITGFSAGSRYTLSYAARSNVDNISVNPSVEWRISTARPVLVDTHTAGSEFVRKTNWTRRSSSAYVPYDAGVVGIVLYVAPPTGVQWQPGDYVDFDAFRFAQGESTVYLDGDSPGASWVGTPNASNSTWSAPVPRPIIDPDCPAPPTPPAPPAPPLNCLTLPTTWLRRFVNVPASTTQVARSAAPVLRITTEGQSARSVRVRVFANPFDREAYDIDPCSKCGEFVISYLPPNALMTIDSVSRRVTVAADGATQAADHLIYDSSGGPVIWPEMACGVPYLIEIGVDATSDPVVGLEADIVPLY